MKTAIILTATIDPKNMILVERKSAEQRLNDYLIAFDFWCKNTQVKNIVFIENSGYNLEKFENKKKIFHDKNIEIISLNLNDTFSNKLGKGYGEHLCIKETILKSNILKDTDIIFKISGRYVMKNFDKIFSSCKKDTNSINVYTKDNLSFIDSFFISAPKIFFKDYVVPHTKNVNDSKNIFFEHCLSKALLSAMSDGYKLIQIPVLPIIEGYIGTNNKKFKYNIFKKIKLLIYGKLKNYFISHKKY